MSRLETAVVRAVPWLGAGLVASMVLLAVPTSWSRQGVFLVQLSALVAFGVGLASRLAPLLDDSWFTATSWSDQARRLAGAVAIVVVATGFTGLVTLASSAALRLQPSLQFLQLLSALDIAWAGAAIVVGLHRWKGRQAALGGGAALGAFCVWSIWNYLHVVGLTADGGWLLDGAELLRLVIPYDMAAALVAGGVLLAGVRRQPIEQLSAQS